MTEGIELRRLVLGWPLTVSALPAGRDWSVTVLGGQAPHVGSVSLAEYEDGGVVLRTLLRRTHKDQIVGDRFARALAERCRCTVCVACGIHYDRPTREQLGQITACAWALLDSLLQAVGPARGPDSE